MTTTNITIENPDKNLLTGNIVKVNGKRAFVAAIPKSILEVWLKKLVDLLEIDNIEVMIK